MWPETKIESFGDKQQIAVTMGCMAFGTDNNISDAHGNCTQHLHVAAQAFQMQPT